jgi:hypothetical protein
MQLVGEPLVKAGPDRYSPVRRSREVEFRQPSTFGPNTRIFVPFALEPLDLVRSHVEKVKAQRPAEVVLGYDLRIVARHSTMADDKVGDEAVRDLGPAKLRLRT